VCPPLYRTLLRNRFQLSCSDPTFQKSTRVWVRTGCVAPGGVTSATTPWMDRPPPLITNIFSMTPWEVPAGTPGTFNLISWLPVQSGLTV